MIHIMQIMGEPVIVEWAGGMVVGMIIGFIAGFALGRIREEEGS